MYNNGVSSFLLDLNSHMSSPFIIGYVHPNICLIHYMENHILFPRQNNFSHLIRSDFVAVWLLAKKIETNLTSAVFQHMSGSKRKGICLPYDDLVTKIFEHVGYNFEGELLMQNVTKNRINTEQNRRWGVFQKPPKGKKKPVKQ